MKSDHAASYTMTCFMTLGTQMARSRHIFGVTAMTKLFILLTPNGRLVLIGGDFLLLRGAPPNFLPPLIWGANYVGTGTIQLAN